MFDPWRTVLGFRHCIRYRNTRPEVRVQMLGQVGSVSPKSTCRTRFARGAAFGLPYLACGTLA
jgi:hypothetical protein